MAIFMLPDRFAYFRTTACQVLLIILLGGLVYSQTLHAPFEFDDFANIVDNEKLASLSTYLHSISWGTFSPKGRWLALATFAINKSLSTGDITGFHIVNILIHLTTAITVYFLTKITLATFGAEASRRYALVPFLAALGFVLHPVQTQAVTYIVQRMTSLATLFYLGTILLYALSFSTAAPSTKSDTVRTRALYPLALILSLLAISSKEISVTLPVTIALYDFCFLSGSTKQRLTRLTPFAVIMLVMPLYLLGADAAVVSVTHGGGSEQSRALPRLTDLYTESRVIVTYLRLLLLPIQQNFDYDYPVYDSLLQLPVLLSLTLICSLLWSAWRLLKISHAATCRFPVLMRVSGYAICWFFITLSIESVVVPLLDTIVEHRLYLPSVWFFIAGAFLVVELTVRAPAAKKVVVTVTALLFMASGYATMQRNTVWRDFGTFWGDVVAKSPNKARALSRLGKHYADKLEPAKAIPLLERAIAINPGYAPSHYALGLALAQRGDSQGALLHYLMTARLIPKSSKGWLEAARICMEEGNTADAARYFQRAFDVEPNTLTAQERSWLMSVNR
jgi:hypothetical protein